MTDKQGECFPRSNILLLPRSPSAPMLRLETRSEELRELRTLEVLEVLEGLGTAEARQMLQKLAGGAPNARLTKDANDSLARLGRSRAARQ